MACDSVQDGSKASGDTGETDGQDDSCVDEPLDLNLAWPLSGTDAQDWVTVQYVDLDEGSGLADYAGQSGSLAKTYDGHQGVDIGISSFRRMDEGVAVMAAASGVVEYVIDGFEDRHTSCVDFDANVVSVRHESGYLLHYVHLRTGSIEVSLGDEVVAGDVLAEVGSSGCSDGPHLHFEITGLAGEVVDPFDQAMWCDPPVYDTPLGLMEAWILAGPDTQYENPTQDPPEEVSALASGGTLLAYGTVGGGLVGDEIAVQLVGPDGTTIGPWPVTFEQSWQLTTWSWAFTVKAPFGTWSAEYLVNGGMVEQKEFELQ